MRYTTFKDGSFQGSSIHVRIKIIPRNISEIHNICIGYGVFMRKYRFANH